MCNSMHPRSLVGRSLLGSCFQDCYGLNDRWFVSTLGPLCGDRWESVPLFGPFSGNATSSTGWQGLCQISSCRARLPPLKGLGSAYSSDFGTNTHCQRFSCSPEVFLILFIYLNERAKPEKSVKTQNVKKAKTEWARKCNAATAGCVSRQSLDVLDNYVF